MIAFLLFAGLCEQAQSLSFGLGNATAALPKEKNCGHYF